MTTPRTLSECRFVTGYPIVTHHRRSLRDRAAGALYLAVTLALFAGIGVLLAWRG